MEDYELKPSRKNPDLKKAHGGTDPGPRQMGGQTPTFSDRKRLTWFHPDFGSYVLKDFVTPEQLVERFEIMKELQAERRKKPSIAARLHEGAKQAKEHREPPNTNGAGSGRTVMPRRRRNIPLYVMVSPEELEQLHTRMDEAGVRNMSAFVRKMALNGYILHVDLSPSGNWFPCNGGAPTTSIRWQFTQTPTACTGRDRRASTGLCRAVGTHERHTQTAFRNRGAVKRGSGAGPSRPRLFFIPGNFGPSWPED